MSLLEKGGERIVEEYSRPELLILGIDPGTTTGYAALSLEGELIGVGSAKELGQNALVQRVVSFGRVVVIGTDKHKCPAFVEKIAARLGARLIVPRQDMSIEGKRLLCKGKKTQNDHELDALASALFAHQSLKPLLSKIQRHLSRLNETEHTYDVAKIVLTQRGVSVSRALGTLKAPEKIGPFKKNLKPSKPKEFTPKERTRLQQDNKLLRSKNRRLRLNLRVLKRKHTAAKERLHSIVDEKKAKRLLALKDRNMASLRRTLKAKDKALDTAQKQIARRDHLLADTNSFIVLKRLENLSKSEWLKKGKYLRVHKGDILLIDNPNTANKKVIAQLATTCDELIYLTLPKSIAQSLRKAGFTLLDGRQLKLKRVGPFTLISRGAFNRERERQLSLTILLTEYKKERKTTL